MAFLAIVLFGAICFICGCAYVLRNGDTINRIHGARLDGLEASNQIVMKSLKAQNDMLQEWHRQNGGR